MGILLHVKTDHLHSHPYRDAENRNRSELRKILSTLLWRKAAVLIAIPSTHCSQLQSPHSGRLGQKVQQGDERLSRRICITISTSIGRKGRKEQTLLLFSYLELREDSHVIWRLFITLCFESLIPSGSKHNANKYGICSTPTVFDQLLRHPLGQNMIRSPHLNVSKWIKSNETFICKNVFF